LAWPTAAAIWEGLNELLNGDESEPTWFLPTIYTGRGEKMSGQTNLACSFNPGANGDGGHGPLTVAVGSGLNNDFLVTRRI
jgi:hypothetical protein